MVRHVWKQRSGQSRPMDYARRACGRFRRDCLSSELGMDGANLPPSRRRQSIAGLGRCRIPAPAPVRRAPHGLIQRHHRLLRQRLGVLPGCKKRGSTHFSRRLTIHLYPPCTRCATCVCPAAGDHPRLQSALPDVLRRCAWTRFHAVETRGSGWTRSFARSNLDVLMLSGGEPTIHPQFADILPSPWNIPSGAFSSIRTACASRKATACCTPSPRIETAWNCSSPFPVSVPMCISAYTAKICCEQTAGAGAGAGGRFVRHPCGGHARTRSGGGVPYQVESTSTLENSRAYARR